MVEGDGIVLKKILLVLALGAFLSAPALAAEKPLLQEGKKTIFERVVSHPGAIMYEDEKATKEVGKPRTFTSFYVYDRKGDMVKVGVSASASDGWIKTSDTTDWPQAITMLFTDRQGRDPVLFFRDHKAVEDLCASDGIGEKVKGYLEEINSGRGKAAKDSPVIAAEPSEKEGAVAEDNFYLLPVLEMDNQFGESGTKLLKVACIDPGNGEDQNKKGKKAAEKPKKDKPMKTGIVFVVDTTMSMGPYIEKTKEIIRKVYDQLQDSPVKDDVSIAVVAFRSNVEKRPKTQYNTKIISDFATVNERARLEDLLSETEECQASTHAFDEDSLAGVQEAIERLSWDGIDSRAMLLITDAGPLASDDPTSNTGMSPQSMAALLNDKKIFLTVAHVKSPAGKKANDLGYAEKSYRDLSLMDNGRSSYIPIDAPTPQQGAKNFDKVGTVLASKYRQIAELTAANKRAPKPKTEDIPESASPEEKAARMAEAIGYSMQLQFAGNQNDTGAPQVVSAWVADADLPSLEANPQAAPIPVVKPAVLLTKSQLSELRKQLANLIDNAEKAFLQGNENFNFYEQLLSAAAKMSSDPSSFSKDPNANLAQKGVISEVLDGLPYKSQVLRLTQDNWINMSTGEQSEFIRRLRGLLKLYNSYDMDAKKWESFGSPNPNEWVFRVPLNELP